MFICIFLLKKRSKLGFISFLRLVQQLSSKNATLLKWELPSAHPNVQKTPRIFTVEHSISKFNTWEKNFEWNEIYYVYVSYSTSKNNVFKNSCLHIVSIEFTYDNCSTYVHRPLTFIDNQINASFLSPMMYFINQWCILLTARCLFACLYIIRAAYILYYQSFAIFLSNFLIEKWYEF